MQTTLKPPRKPIVHDRQPLVQERQRPRRSAWRQRLVEAERGVTLGLREDSTLFVHLFSGCVILATATVLGLSIVEWAVMLLGLAVVVAAEMFNKVLIELGRLIPGDVEPTASLRNSLKIATAAVFVTMAGTLSAIGLMFAHHLWLLVRG